MLELPESYRIATQVNEHLKGKIISSVELLHTPHKFAWVTSEQGSVEEHLEGQTIEGARFHGGILEIDTEDSMLLLSDGAFPKYYEEKNCRSFSDSLPVCYARSGIRVGGSTGRGWV